MARRPKPRTIDEMIAFEVRRALEQRFGLTGKVSRRVADKVGAKPARKRAARKATRGSASRGAAPVPAAAALGGAASTGAGGMPGATAAEDIVDRVRSELQLAYDGRPVSPDRLAFRLKADRVLVDAALSYLVTRKEARMMGARGKVAYVPQRARS